MKRRPNGVALACLVLVALIVTLALTATRGSSGIPLASDNSGPSGAQALAKVLEHHGVSVRTARTQDDIDRPVSADTTVFVAGDATLDADARSRLLDAVHGAGRLVVVEPTPDMRTQLFPPSGDSGAGGDGVAPDVEFGRAHGGTTPVAVNDSTIFTNATIASDNNAASALRLLGATRDVLWIADWQGSTSRASDEQGLAWPDWKGPLTWALACTVGVLALTRGRRFGPLVTEPLPVVVPASESTRALATLFRRSTTRESAADALRRGCAARLAPRLGLGAGHTHPDDVARALRGDDPLVGASRRISPQRAAELADHLTGPVPETDRELVHLATALQQLEKEMTS